MLLVILPFGFGHGNLLSHLIQVCPKILFQLFSLRIFAYQIPNIKPVSPKSKHPISCPSSIHPKSERAGPHQVLHGIHGPETAFGILRLSFGVLKGILKRLLKEEQTQSPSTDFQEYGHFLDRLKNPFKSNTHNSNLPKISVEMTSSTRRIHHGSRIKNSAKSVWKYNETDE